MGNKSNRPRAGGYNHRDELRSPYNQPGQQQPRAAAQQPRPSQAPARAGSSGAGRASQAPSSSAAPRTASQPVRCPHCRRLLQPPPNHARFLCPCGRLLQSPAAVQQQQQQAQTTQQRVRCPNCNTMLVPPPSAPIFRCPCGQHLRSPHLQHHSSAQIAAPSKGGAQSEAAVKANAAVASILQKRGARKWVRGVVASSPDALHWVRLLTDEEENEILELELEVMESLTEESLRKVEIEKLKLGLDRMNVAYDDCEDENDKIIKRVIESHDLLMENASTDDLRSALSKIGVQSNNCTEKEDFVARLLAGAFAKEKLEAYHDGFVRDFKKQSDLDMTWVLAKEFKIHTRIADQSATFSVISPREILSVSNKPFMEKLEWFRARCQDLRIKWEDGHVRIRIRRQKLLEDSFNSFLKLKAADMRRYFRFEFIGEPGVDAGGVAREWFGLVSDMCYNVDFGLFEYSGVDNVCYQINPSSGIANDLHHKYFRFLGRLLGKALFDGHQTTAHLTQTMYKHMLAWPIMLADVEFVDPQIYNSLLEIRKVEDVEMLCLDFTTAVRVFGETVTIELKPGGEDIDVTNENRNEYINLLMKHLMLDRVSSQLAHFLRGFYEVIPPALLSVFDYHELELLLCGLPNIDVEDWYANTRYRGAYLHRGKGHKVIQWFWQIIREMSEEQRAKFLQFSTGTSRVPVQGFAALQGNDGNVKPFTIDSVPITDSVYCRAHTCFNRIELPVYQSLEEMRDRIIQVTTLELVGFGIE